MRKVEIYTGAYASGKSENAINSAMNYVKNNKEITLVRAGACVTDSLEQRLVERLSY